jgi:ornithine cyclodeaminase
MGRFVVYIPESKLGALLDWSLLADALQDMFAQQSCEAPSRHHHTIPVPGNPDATLLLMPAWQSGAYIGVKLSRYSRETLSSDCLQFRGCIY